MRGVGYIPWAVRISSIRSALVEELILVLLSHAQSNATHATLYVLPSTTFHILYTANESSLEEYYPRTYPSESGTPVPVFASYCLLAKPPPSRLAPSCPSLPGIGASSNFSSKSTRRSLFSSAGSTSQHPLESPVIAIWCKWCRVANAEDGGGLFRRIYIRRR